MADAAEGLEEELERLEAELRDRQAALPKHSIRPWQIQEVEELEEKIKELKKRIGQT
jgi:chromosome segregation ATPase